MKTKIIGIAILILIGVGLLPATRDGLKWHFASSGDKAQNYAEYLAAWPSGRHSAEARSRYDERSWADAQAGKTLESYRQYEQTHLSGAHMAEARTRIEDLTWQHSTNAETIQSLETYLKGYDRGRLAAAARTRIEIQSFEAYLKGYDRGRFASAARTRIEDLTWRQSTNTDTIQSFEAYLKTYDTGRFAAAARTRIEDLTWQSTSANTIRSLRAYAEAYPKGRYLTKAQSRQVALRTDDAPYSAALQKGTETALNDFLAEFPGHAKEADAKQAIKDITEGRDIVDLLAEKKVEIQTQGSGIQNVSVRVRRLVSYPLTIRVPVGSYFVSSRQSAQNMVTTAESKVRLTTDDWRSMSVSAACANRPRDIPSSGDSFTVQRSPQQEELARLMPVLDRAGVTYATRQAAVWIVTDNASYSDLGILVSQSQFQTFGGARTIREAESARAMRICTEAGIDVTRKRIWSDRPTILRGLNDPDLKKWLEEKQ